MATGGSRPFDRGWFLAPTIFAGLDNKATDPSRSAGHLR
jgi:aldehyde dehydrogenase (NAD+)